MQNDYFNKLQGASSLFMKSDHDGDKDAFSRKMPLGIKTVAQGLEHFTDWKSLSDVLEQKKLANFEDDQPNSLSFSQFSVDYNNIQLNHTGGKYQLPLPAKSYQSEDFAFLNHEFDEGWKANKIKILDDMAFVSYDEYTDVNRSEVSFGASPLYQYALTINQTVGSNTLESSTSSIGSLSLPFARVSNRSEDVSYEDVSSDGNKSTVRYKSPLAFADYHNSVLKIELESGETAYFLYGGPLANDLDESFSPPLNIDTLKHSEVNGPSRTINNDVNISTCASHASHELPEREWGGKYFDDTATFEDGAIWGRFFLVQKGFDENGPWENGLGREYIVGDNNNNLCIQLSIQANVSSLTFLDSIYDSNSDKNDLYYRQIGTKNVKLIKFQPVRKCGKVDIYTKKRSIVGSILGNKITSNNHNLSTNDIIEISNALFDGTQNGVADKHPLNGTKYVRPIDDDTFEIYDDEFFEKPSFTNDLRTTDGITWTCISNNFGSIGQSWDYHGSIFSPTGRNGYKSVSTSKDRGVAGAPSYHQDELAALNEFFTSNRIGKVKDFTSEQENKASINLNFGAEYEDLVNSSFAEDIDNAIPRSFSGYSPLDDPERAYWDFYPYAGVSTEIYGDDQPGHLGTRFGCDLDIKYSHMSGGSRVYVLAVGERGSDVSVDLFGIGADTRRINNGSMYGWNRGSALPWSLPHGKTHLITITVDQYNRISDISHSNTMFGGGVSIVDNSNYDEKREYNPWDYGLRHTIRPSYIRKEFDNDYSIFKHYEDNADTYNNTYYTRPDGQRVYHSSYWLRSAVVHWYENDIFEYRIGDSSQRGQSYFRRIQMLENLRATIPVEANNIDNRSRFGSVGFGGEAYQYKRIDRHSDEKSFFIFPWVDSFGKSVAIKSDSSISTIDGYSNSDPKYVVVSSSTTRSNIEYNEGDYSIPLANSDLLEEQDTQSRIGQLQANFIYSDGSSYSNADFVFINSDGGDCGRFFSSPTTRTDPNGSLIGGSNAQRVLKTGIRAGYDMPEVMSACSLSALCLEWHDNQIAWVDQDLYGARSIVNILSFDDTGVACFNKHKQFFKNFIDPRGVSTAAEGGLPTATNTGDGFGIQFKFDQGVFVTNSRETTTELGLTISDYVNNRDRIDYVQVYEELINGYEQTQKISASINKLDEKKYSLYLLSYDNQLLDIPGSVAYDNNSINTLTWDIDFNGRYDLVNNKILIKDPLEYSLFSRNYSISRQEMSPSETEEFADMYMAISEDVKLSDRRSSNLLEYKYIPQETDEYVCRQIGGPESETTKSSTPFFFYKLPINNLDLLENLTIDFDILSEEISSTFNIKGDLNLLDQTDNIIPRVVIYSVDPRSTIIENGPADNGSSNSFPKYQNGIWSQFSQIDEDGEYYSYDFPGWYRGGAQDLFFYARQPIGLVKTGSVSIPNQPPSYLYGGEVNLGEYYDSTVGSRLSGTAGDPAWVAPDVFRHLSQSQRDSLVPYAKIFLPQATQDGYRVTIPRDVLKDYIIRGGLLKDTDRPSSVVSGFNDTANSYDVDDINHSIVVGLLLTNVESFDLSSSTLTHEEPSTQFVAGATQYILTDTTNDYVNARYPYSNVCNFYKSTFNGNEYSGRRLEYDLGAVVRSLSVSVSKRENTHNRYSNKFHKIAVFAYDQEPRQEVAETITDKDIRLVKSLGYNNFVPLPDKSSSNPIISIGRKSSVFAFGGDRDVLNTENISFNDTTYQINKDSGDFDYDETPLFYSSFDQASLLGGFDLDQDRFLSLNISSNPEEDEGIKLHQRGMVAESGGFTLIADAFTGEHKDTSLWIGVLESDKKADLFVSGPDHQRPMSLFTYESQPFLTSDLFIRSIDSENDISLAMAPPTTGTVSLYINGPLPENNDMTLAWVPTFSGDISAYVQGVAIQNSGITLKMDAVVPHSQDATLAFSPGRSGNIPLFLARNLESSGNPSLVIPNTFDVNSGSMPLKISRNTDEGSVDAFIKSQRYYNESADLYIDSQSVYSENSDLFINSPVENISNLNTYIRSVFPSGELDLVLKPIDRTVSSGIFLHMANSLGFIPLHMEKVLPIEASLVIGGFAPEYDQNVNMFLNTKIQNNNTDLFIDSISNENNDASLVSIGSVEISNAVASPLFIGKEINSSAQSPLLIANDIFANSLGSNVVAGLVSASVSGGLNYNKGQYTTLFMNAPQFGSGDQQATAFLKVQEPVLSSDGNIIQSGVSDFVIVGNNNANILERGIIVNNDTSMFIANRDLLNDDMTLFVDRPEENIAPLFMRSLYGSGDVNVYISGASIDTQDMSLHISSPETSLIKIFTRGYLE